MNRQSLERMRNDKGFIAALDQSGGSTPKALGLYGIEPSAYDNESQMFDLVHEMRTRIIKSPAFSGEQILGAILFEQTMDRLIDDQYTADFLRNTKGILPFLKVDKGLAEEENGVQLMKPIPDLDSLLDRALERNIFGTKMRSVIKENNPEGIRAIVDQQFEIGKQILAKGLMPILEPEVDIHAADKEGIEDLLKEEIRSHLDSLADGEQIMLKLTIPTKDDFYRDLIDHPNILRVVALSGGYTREESNERLRKQPGLIASFSRALSEGLNVHQTEEEFNHLLRDSVQSIYDASAV